MRMAGMEELIVRALREEWDHLRYQHALPLRPPGFMLHGGRSRLGLWMRGQRTISLSREHCLEDRWLEVSETLRHELAHQLVDEVYGGEPDPHGPMFHAALERLGALPGAVGEEPPVMARVRKLLALAASPNQHEAELAMAHAQRLMIKHRIASAAADGSRGVIRRQLGEPRARQPRWLSALAATVGEHFFVEVIRVTAFMVPRGEWGFVWEVAGRPEDVEMASYAFEFVERTAERLWAGHLARTPGAGRSRERFLLGVVLGFGNRLDATAAEARAEGLVPVADAEVLRAFGRRYPRVRTRSSGGMIIDQHFHAGEAAGGEVLLHRPIRSTGGGGGLLEG